MPQNKNLGHLFAKFIDSAISDSELEYSITQLLSHARVAGLFPIYYKNAKIILKKYDRHLNLDYSQIDHQLLAELIRAGEEINFADFNLNWDSLPKQLQQSLSINFVGVESVNFSINQTPFYSLRTLEYFKCMAEQEFLTLQPLNIVNHYFEQIEVKRELRSAIVIKTNDVRLFPESDLKVIGNKVFLDYYTFSEAITNNPINDRLILSVDYANQIVKFKKMDMPNEILDEKVIWAALPMSDQWGHFSLEVLPILAYAFAEGLLNNSRVAISSNVPSNFLKLASLIWPTIHWLHVNPETSYIISEVYFIPSRSFLSHNPFQRVELNPTASSGLPDVIPYNIMRNEIASSIKKSSLLIDHDDVIFLDRSYSWKKHSPDELEIIKFCRKLGIRIVDPGGLDPNSEVELFLKHKKFIGFVGSQWHLSFLSEPDTSALIIGNSFYFEYLSFSSILTNFWGKQPLFFLLGNPGELNSYSETLLHQKHAIDVKELKRHIVDFLEKKI